MKYNKHKNYFETAYKTGSDTWSNIERKNQGKLLTTKLENDSLVLEVGSGRGFFSKKLAEQGYRVIGLDFENNIIEKLNKEIKNWKLDGRLKFVHGDVFDIPFTDESFDGVVSFGLMEYLHKEDWPLYKDEVLRVLKKGAYFLNVSISRETENFLGFRPKKSEDGNTEKFDINYHFFTEEEINNIFGIDFSIIENKLEHINDFENITYIETLMQKK